MVYKWMHEDKGVVDETCQPYQAKSKSCDAEHICKDCQHNGHCHAIDSPARYKVEQYGFVKGEHQMMAEIQKRGPISCRQAVTKAFFAYKGGIFKDTTGDKKPRHATALIGWGKTASGEKYWIARNSWGTYWGEQGHFKIVRGQNQLGIEDECSWGVPQSSGVIEKSEERLMGMDDKLVTNEDLGASIDGAESLVDETSSSDDGPVVQKRVVKQDVPAAPAVQPMPVVDSQDNHADAFFHTAVSDDIQPQKVEGSEPAPHLGLADADPMFQKQQQQDGVQA